MNGIFTNSLIGDALLVIGGIGITLIAIFILMLIWAVIWAILKPILQLFGFFIERCPKCNKKENFIFEGSKILDRYDTSKEVVERTATGKRKTRYMKCTKIVKQKQYRCAHCGYQCVTKVTEELT